MKSQEKFLLGMVTGAAARSPGARLVRARRAINFRAGSSSSPEGRAGWGW